MANVVDRLLGARSLRRGVLLGVAAGIAVGALWFVIVLGTTSAQSYVIPAFGIGVAYAVFAGMHRPGATAAAVSVVITATSLMLATYYVERHLVITFFKDNGDSKKIPLIPYLDWLGEVLGHALTKSPGPPIYSALALVAAGWFGYRGFESLDQSHRRG